MINLINICQLRGNQSLLRKFKALTDGKTIRHSDRCPDRQTKINHKHFLVLVKKKVLRKALSDKTAYEHILQKAVYFRLC